MTGLPAASDVVVRAVVGPPLQAWKGGHPLVSGMRWFPRQGWTH
ncbi:hypothetical protein MicB006_1248 [Micromonospora sp. B006]|nr:hypothetical protein MicB006_1248 [Micromonospora sp. B006]